MCKGCLKLKSHIYVTRNVCVKLRKVELYLTERKASLKPASRWFTDLQGWL